MKKLLSSLFLLLLIFVGTQQAKAMKYEQAINQSKPMAIFVYAPWADGYTTMLQSFNALQQKYGEKYNFVTMNIATDDAKVYNQKYYIYPNLPYVMLFRERGKFSRFIEKNCAQDTQCLSTKMDLFNN